MAILVSGGAGYIGSHTVVALMQSGYNVIVLDNLSNSSFESIVRVSQICGLSPEFIEGDIRDLSLLRSIFSDHVIDGVMHFAGLKSVSESVSDSLRYYDNNVGGTICLLKAMQEAHIKTLVFSSSATVYGDADQIPVRESSGFGVPKNPYGQSKLMVEKILTDLACSDESWRIAVLRYFNPAGAHFSGLIGESPKGVPNNLIPYLSQVAIGKLQKLSVFGSDYLTPDGTGVRDYIHVMDLADGHLKALSYIEQHQGLETWNLGTGRGYSVLEMIRAFELASGQSIPFGFTARRSGDVAECWADTSKAHEMLGWKAQKDLSLMMKDAWRWQSMNPDGY